MTWRAELERRSIGPLRWLSARPRWLLPVLTAVLLLVGLSLRGAAGSAVLFLVAAFLGWLLALSWPLVSPASKTIRLLILVALVAVAAGRLT